MTIQELIASGEGQRIEFKSSFSEDNEAIESLCAFSNSEGGTVLVGVSDSGEVVGVSLGRNTLENFANKLRDSTSPPLYVSVDSQELYGKKTIEISVKPPRLGELFYAFGKPLIRVGRTNQVISPPEQQQRLLEGTVNKQIPKVSVGILSENGIAEEAFIPIRKIPPEPDYEEQVKIRKTELLSRYELEKEAIRSLSTLLQNMIWLNPDFLKDLDSYLGKYRNYLKARREFIINSDRLKYVRLGAENLGGSSVEDVTVELLLPDIISIPPDSEMLFFEAEEPYAPSEPVVKSSSIGLFGSGHFDSFLSPSINGMLQNIGQHDVDGPLYEERGGSTVVTYRIRRLVPSLLERDCDPFAIWLGEIEGDLALEVQCIIYAANLPEPSTNTLKLDIRISES